MIPIFLHYLCRYDCILKFKKVVFIAIEKGIEIERDDTTEKTPKK